MGKDGKREEVDEALAWRELTEDVQKTAKASGCQHKMEVLSRVGRESGRARSFVVGHVNAETIQLAMRANLAQDARLMTDERAG